MKKLFQPAARLHVVLAVAAGMALSAGIGVASGAIPSSDGKINACQAKVGGFRYLRLLDTGESCRGGEKPLSWNQKGPKGDPGPAGPAGPKGTGGTKASLRTEADTIPAGGGSVTSHCLNGSHVTGGGFEVVDPDPTGLQVSNDGPNSGLTEWVVGVENTSGRAKDVLAFAICAS
jgi:hypothetical protein